MKKAFLSTVFSIIYLIAFCQNNNQIASSVVIQNQWNNHYLSAQNSIISCWSGDSYKWMQINISGTQNFYLKVPATGFYLTDGNDGTLILSNQITAFSVWTSEIHYSSVQIKNVSTNRYINNQHGRFDGSVECTGAFDDWESGLWKFLTDTEPTSVNGSNNNINLLRFKQADYDILVSSNLFAGIDFYNANEVTLYRELRADEVTTANGILKIINNIRYEYVFLPQRNIGRYYSTSGYN